MRVTAFLLFFLISLPAWADTAAKEVEVLPDLNDNPANTNILDEQLRKLGRRLTVLEEAGAGVVTGFDNPSASVGLTAVNGTATTALRSDAAPALSQGISPLWTGQHKFYPGAGDTIFGAGNVGIGSNVASTKLDVLGTIKQTGFQLTTNPSAGYLLVGTSAGVGTWMSATTLPIQNFWARTSPNVYPATITDNIGVGTSLPNNKFTVYGNVGIGSSDISNGITALKGGSLAYGYAVANITTPSQANRIYSSGEGALAGGYTKDNGCGGQDTYDQQIEARGNGSVALGLAQAGCGSGGAGTMLASGNGAFAMGAVVSSIQTTSTLTASVSGAMAVGYSSGGDITASGLGSFAGGRATGTEGVGNASITSSGNGSFAYGYAIQGNSSISAGGTGGVAMGYADGGKTLSAGDASNPGSMAFGHNVQVLGTDAIGIGTGLVNTTSGSFMVGFQRNPTLYVDRINVGIGTRTPTTTLDTIGTIKASVDVKVGSNSVCQSDGTNCPFGGGGWTDDGTVVRLSNGSDNVGIGTVTPGYPLDLNGRFRTNTGLCVRDVGTGTYYPVNISAGVLTVGAGGGC